MHSHRSLEVILMTNPVRSAWPASTVFSKLAVFAVIGSHVIRIGGYTAETAGTVLTVCSSFDVNYTDVGWVRILCTMTASYAAGSGDSGGPVFEQWEAGDPAIPVGIHIGRSSSPVKSWMSPLNGIDADFGWNWVFH